MLATLLSAALIGATVATAGVPAPVAPRPEPSPTPVAAPTAEAAVTAAPGATLRLPANTVVELEMVDAVSSRTSKPKDFFRLRVAEDVRVDGRVLIPAGTEALGQVVHAAKSGSGGKAGELILAARAIKLPRGDVKLRSGFGAAGQQRTGAALATTIAVGVFGLFVHGKELLLPAGTPVSARVAEDTDLPLP
jgi:hypothetical protein